MRKTLTATLTVGMVALGAIAAFAHGGASGVVKERMDQMVVLREAMKALKGELALGGPYDADTVVEAAREIKAHSGAALTAKFPQGSLSGASEALPSVWTDWERFSALAMQLETYAAALETAALNHVLNDPGAAMGDGNMMMGGGLSGMMGGADSDAALLAQMPPMTAFIRIADTCTACHTSFRQQKGH